MVLSVCSVGQKTCMHVHGVFPYLFVCHYATAEPLPSYLHEFAAALDRAINISLGNAASTRQHIYKISVVSGMSVNFTLLISLCLNRNWDAYCNCAAALWADIAWYFRERTSQLFGKLKCWLWGCCWSLWQFCFFYVKLK